MKTSTYKMSAIHLARGATLFLGMLFCSIANAGLIDFAFTSGGLTSSTATNGAFTATINADGGQQFNYPTSYLRSARGSSGDTLTLSFNQAIDSLSFDVGSLDAGNNNESLVFALTPIVSAVSSVDWSNGGLAVLTGNTLSSGGANAATARVSFMGLGGITSFSFAEVFTGHAIYFDNFTVNTGSGVVPAPATLALFGLGLAGLGWSKRKKA
ncbi:PEP-CTERM sorting domain-containing protein [Candidatus Litorirhabdus singularis]|nr:PEP-CTERM sorting domain-containing protein [Candidatus Litorirhabdus singularis]